ncbi:early growth response protein 1-like [Astyanax mexicanus]|uniref:Early growth response protein 1-like n=1 Tax=Astyanax mexicanus TaxID=7994 RepID=A0A8T2L2T5_ASTMX|nr:early growth response protein 1-like [Astyanax mexicanus]
MLKAFLLIAVVVVELCGTVWCTMEYSRNMHITIQEGRAMPKLERCTTCCKKFHCPFCSSSLFNPTKLSKVKTHLVEVVAIQVPG